ncbi:MAG: thioredoxin domain-containing protein [Pyrobaculum sp.]
MGERTICLERSKSPFVLQSLNSKVQWWGWCPEAFEKARSEDKPILIDVGAVWCHWCHVMDETTYEDDEVAEFINRHYIAIKVDRDERPDIDRRLQEVAALLGSQTGWPLTVFMTPSGEVIWAATYIPPRDVGGQPGMLRVLEAVLKAYRERRSDIQQLFDDLKKEISAWHSPAPGELDRGLEVEALARLMAQFDDEYGGFGRAPKFPPITQLDLLALRYFYDRVEIYRKAAEKTLDAMALGGLYDHVGGGFFRYAVDRTWSIPHFEKLLIDNVELLSVYVKWHILTKKELYKDAAVGVVNWLDDFMRDPEGGYYASQDADVDGEEGGYYLWTFEEFKEALGELAEAATRHFYFLDGPGGRIHLAVREPAKAGEIYRRLKEYRSKRRPPYVDTTIYTGWNCAAARAELEGFRLTGVGNREHALKTLERVYRSLWDGSRLRRGLRNGVVFGEGMLEDYSYCILACLEAFSHTGDFQWLDFGVELGGVLTTRFLKEGGFVDVEHTDFVLNSLHYPVVDSPNYSGNSLAVMALDFLHYITGVGEFREAASKALKALVGKISALGPAASGLLIALDFHLAEPPRTVVVGSSVELLKTALSIYRPGHLVVPLRGSWRLLDSAILQMLKGPAPRAYVCTRGVCSLPIDKPETLSNTILEFNLETYRL